VEFRGLVNLGFVNFIFNGFDLLWNTHNDIFLAYHQILPFLARLELPMNSV
jgi:hypothetical protein